ncbi:MULTISPECIES: FtsX-like permease family protein [Anaeromyxobacter]|uniref:FtsX-like permease family protein n=1 Tax=Anaeromyxobacter TaxID=161492 RepID=UPI001F5AE964|nr:MULTISPECIES: FtsX-like permease family protein [unclassified Anaeromyxobacter]
MAGARGILWLAGAALRADRRGAAVNAAAACVGAAALVLFLALGLGVGAAARRLFPADARLVEVVPARVSLGGVLGGGRLDDDAVGRLRALPGAAAAWPRLPLGVPVSASEPAGGLGGRWPSGLALQLPIVGVDPALVEEDVAPGAFADPPPGAPIPTVLARRLVEVYDRTLAPAWNLRRLPPGVSLVGVELPVRVGHSVVAGASEARVEPERLRLAGLSDRVPLYAVAVPLETVRRLHREYGKGDAAYGQVTVLAARPEDVPALAAAARRMGFAVDEGERATAERVALIVKVTTGALVLLAVAMCALAALAIAQALSASVRGRVRELAVLQALGAAPADVRRIVLAEGAAIGLAGGLAGALVARGLAALGDAAAARLLADLPFRPESFFLFPPWLLALGVAVPALAAIAGALGPAAAAARVDPARTLS